MTLAPLREAVRELTGRYMVKTNKSGVTKSVQPVESNGKRTGKSSADTKGRKG